MPAYTVRRTIHGLELSSFDPVMFWGSRTIPVALENDLDSILSILTASLIADLSWKERLKGSSFRHRETDFCRKLARYFGLDGKSSPRPKHVKLNSSALKKRRTPTYIAKPLRHRGTLTEHIAETGVPEIAIHPN